jgi:hypothetical protein
VFFSCSAAKEVPAAPSPGVDGETVSVSGHKGGTDNFPDVDELGTESPEFSKPIVVPNLTMKSKTESARTQNRVPAQGNFVIPGGEAPRYPEDFAIGSLGRGGIDPQAYAAARSILGGMRSGVSLSTFFPGMALGERNRIKGSLDAVRASTIRIGGGRVEQGGGISFLIRLIGPDLSLAGEIYVIYKDGSWIGEDVRMDEPITNRTPDGMYRFDPISYTRFL